MAGARGAIPWLRLGRSKRLKPSPPAISNTPITTAGINSPLRPGKEILLRRRRAAGQRPAALNQGQQGIEDLWRQRDGLTSAEDYALARIEAELAKLITDAIFEGLFHLKNFLRTS